MSNWIYGKDLIGHWVIEDFELFGFLKKGLQPYNKHGRKVIDLDSSEWARERTLEYYENLVRGTEEAGMIRTNSGPNVSLLTEQEIKQRGKELYESQTPKDSPYISFSLPSNEKKATIAIASVKSFRFKKDEASKFAEKHGLPRFDQDRSDHTSAEEPNKKEAVETSPEKSNNPEATKLFPCEAGTKWDDIKITLTANDTVRIETPMGESRYTYHELGMKNKKDSKPKIVWDTLKLFAINQGIFPPKHRNYKEAIIKALPEKTKHLNRHLKKLFGIDESIFKYHYNRYKKYETKIKFSDQTIVSEPEPSQDKSILDSELDEINEKFGFSGKR